MSECPKCHGAIYGDEHQRAAPTTVKKRKRLGVWAVRSLVGEHLLTNSLGQISAFANKEDAAWWINASRLTPYAKPVHLVRP